MICCNQGQTYAKGRATTVRTSWVEVRFLSSACSVYKETTMRYVIGSMGIVTLALLVWLVTRREEVEEEWYACCG